MRGLLQCAQAINLGQRSRKLLTQRCYLVFDHGQQLMFQCGAALFKFSAFLRNDLITCGALVR